MKKAVFNEEQIEAIRWDKGPLLVLGTPGSAKTTVITYRILNLIEEKKVRPENILVITFTKAAAESMKERFLNISDRKYENVRFSTFHSFFYWIIVILDFNIIFIRLESLAYCQKFITIRIS